MPTSWLDMVWHHIMAPSKGKLKMMTVLPAIKPLINTIIKSFHFSRLTGEQFALVRGIWWDWSTSCQGLTNKIDQVSQVEGVFYLFYRWVWLFSFWMHMWCTCCTCYAVCIFRVVVNLFLHLHICFFVYWQRGKENVEASLQFWNFQDSSSRLRRAPPTSKALPGGSVLASVFEVQWHGM